MTAQRLARRLRRVAGLAGLVGLVGLLGLAAPLAVAATAPPPTSPTSPNTISWAVAPSTASGNDKRTHFSYTGIKPGTSISDYVGVTNYSNKVVTFNLYASDGITTTAGGIGLAPAAQKSVDVGKWVHFLHNTVTVPPQSRLNEPITMTVPANATPGDHVGGVIASVTQSPVSGKVTREDRVGVAIYLRVAGPLHPALTVESASGTGYHGTVNPFGGGSTTVTYTVRNTGNVRLSGNQTVAVTGLFGIPLATVHPPALEEVLPGDSVQVTTQVTGIFPAGPLTAHIQVDPVAVPGSPPLDTSASAGSADLDMVALPWPQLVLLVVLAAIVFGVLRWRTARRRGHAKALAAAVEQGRREATEQLASATAEAE